MRGGVAKRAGIVIESAGRAETACWQREANDAAREGPDVVAEAIEATNGLAAREVNEGRGRRPSTG